MAYYGVACIDNYPSHFLEACSLCGKPLLNSDIFMYRGNTPFCSKECRQEQIAFDEAKEKKNWKVKNSSSRSSTESKETSNESVRTSSVAVAY